jgi:hypothetical protein
MLGYMHAAMILQYIDIQDTGYGMYWIFCTRRFVMGTAADQQPFLRGFSWECTWAAVAWHLA